MKKMQNRMNKLIKNNFIKKKADVKQETQFKTSVQSHQDVSFLYVICPFHWIKRLKIRHKKIE